MGVNRATFSILLSLTCASALADTNEWQSGWGQGKTEFFAGDEAQSYLNFACDADDETSPVSASATIAGKAFDSHNDNGGFDVIVDGVEYNNPFYVECNACSGYFPEFWAAMRKAKSIQLKAGGLTSSIPVKGFSKLTKSYASKENPCGTGAW
ncbi:hypothetical protein AA303_17235 [Pseudomonas psychrophila]|nr:hypothetical protein AA303_17235 [Pseudomonas psychrophila]